MQTKQKQVTSDDVQYVQDLMDANHLRAHIPEEERPNEPITKCQVDFIKNHASVNGQGHKDMTQDAMKEAMKVYLIKIKHDANDYIKNENINFGEMNNEYALTIKEFQMLFEQYEDEEEQKRSYPSLKHVLAQKYKLSKTENNNDGAGSNEGEDEQKFGKE